MAQYDVQRKVLDQKKSNSDNQGTRTVQLRTNSVAGIIQMAKTNPGMLTQNDVMVLQKTIGNGAIGQLINNTRDQQNETLQKEENNTGLPDNLKAGVENLSGLSMDNVKVHYNSDKPAQVGALAYTQGADIHVATGQEKHLPHEAWHVVQQAKGRVQATTQMKGVAVNDDVALEREADEMGEKVEDYKKIDISTDLKTEKGVQVIHSNMPIQGIFGNKLGIKLNGINSKILGLDDSRFYNYRKYIEDDKSIIYVVDGDPSYDSNNRILYLKEQMLDDLIEICSKILKEENLTEDDKRIVSSHISNITHELSHVRDYIMNKYVNNNIVSVIDTELRAWAVEAISALEAKSSLKADSMDDKNKNLVNGWKEITIDMLNSITNNRKNEIIDRLYRYISRNLKPSPLDSTEIQSWVCENKVRLIKQIQQLERVVCEKAK